jgi:hypothetical protein
MAGLTDLQRYLFDLEGYIVLEGVLSPDEVAHLNSVWDKQQLPPPGETVRSQRFGNEFLSWDGACRRLIDHDAVLPVMIDLCGSTVRLDHAYGIVMAPGTSGLGLHGGGIPFDRSQYYVTENGRMHNGLCVVSWALVDSPPGQGGFCAVPGSHKGAFPRPAEVPTRLVHQVSHRAGDVVIFTEALTHGTLPWTAPFQRRHLLFKYSPGNSAWDRRPSIPTDVLPLLTDRQRLLAEPPYVGGRTAHS